MAVFQIRNGKAEQLDVAEFKNERELQDLFEANLEEFLGVRFLDREYAINSEAGRIDTLGIDESNRPVIIEYKLGTAPDDVLTQGQAYQSRLVKNRRHFDLLVKQKLPDVEVDWQLTRLIFVAKDFGRRMRDAVEDKEGIVLIKYTFIQNGLIVLDKVSGQLEWTRKPPVSKQEAVVVEGLERYLCSTKPELHESFRQLRARIHQFSEAREEILPKTGITYYAIKAFARFEFRKSSIDLFLKSGASSNDPRKRLRDITSHRLGFPYLFKISKPEDFDYAFNLIQAAYLAAT